MTDVNKEMKQSLHAALVKARGRRVSMDKVDDAYHERFGYKGTSAFRRLCEVPFSPWTADCLWEGLDMYESRLSWHTTREDALRAIIGTIDLLRLYPDTIEEGAGGRLTFSAQGKPLFVCQPLRFWQPDPELRTRCEEAFAYCPGKPPQAFSVACKLPGLSTMPHGWLIHGTRLSSEHAVLLQFTPADAAHIFTEIADSMNIRLELEAAQTAVAQGAGFSTWSELESAWAELPSFQPYVVLDNHRKERFFCKDEADALAALAQAASRLKPETAYEWSMTFERDEFAFGIDGPPAPPPIKSARRRRNSDVRPHIVRIQAAPDYSHLPDHLNRSWGRPHYEIGTNEELRTLLGVDRTGAERVALSDTRNGVTALDMSGVHMTAHEDYIGRPQFEFEALDAATGWHKPATRKTWHYGNRLFRYEEESHVELQLGDDVRLVQSDHNGKLETLFTFGCLSQENCAALLAFLKMTVTGSKGHYLRTSSDWLTVHRVIADREQAELVRKMIREKPITLQDYRLAHKKRQAESVERP
jgi:hypothetical protein